MRAGIIPHPETTTSKLLHAIMRGRPSTIGEILLRPLRMLPGLTYTASAGSLSTA